MTSALAYFATNSNPVGGNHASCHGVKVTSDGAGSGTIDCGSSLSRHCGPTGKVSLFQFLH